MNLLPKTTVYDDKISEQKKISFFAKVIVWAGIILAILFMVVLKASVTALIIALVLIIASLIGKKILNKKFLANNKVIVDSYLNFYNGANGRPIDFIDENFGLLETIQTNHLLAFVDNGNLSFISSKFLKILNKKSYDKGYEKTLNQDFGKYNISLDVIDSYREAEGVCVLTMSFQGVRKIKFNQNNVFDLLIPEKEYYYATQKRG